MDSQSDRRVDKKMNQKDSQGDRRIDKKMNRRFRR
jgi:hypothetical protein